MERSESEHRGMYIPIDAFPRDLVSRYGDVRILVVPKERTSSTSSCKENDESCVKSDQNVFDDEAIITDGKNTDGSCTPRQQFEQDRFAKDRKDIEIGGNCDVTPKRSTLNVHPTQIRFDTSPSINTTTQKSFEHNRQGMDSVSEKTRRQLFSGIENEYRFIRNDSYSRNQLETCDESYSPYYPCVEKTSPALDHTRSMFEWETPYYDRPERPLPSPSWSPHMAFTECRRCDCTERQPRHLENCRNRPEMTKKRKFGDTCTMENSVSMSPRLKKVKCTCSMMESNLLQMAEAAYKNIRRRDTTPSSFDQFNKELVQTNIVLKESVSILATIRDMCEHRTSIRS